MDLREEREGLSSMLATTFAETAGVDGRQKWGSCDFQQCTCVTSHLSNGGWGAWGWFRGTPFRSPLQGGLKGLRARGGGGRRSEGRRGLHLRKASRGLQGGLKGASRGLQGGLKGASRGLHLRKASRGLEGGFKGASRGLEGGLKPSALKGASRMLARGLYSRG